MTRVWMQHGHDTQYALQQYLPTDDGMLGGGVGCKQGPVAMNC
jgi:hypothetical protein